MKKKNPTLVKAGYWLGSQPARKAKQALVHVFIYCRVHVAFNLNFFLLLIKVKCSKEQWRQPIRFWNSNISWLVIYGNYASCQFMYMYLSILIKFIHLFCLSKWKVRKSSEDNSPDFETAWLTCYGCWYAASSYIRQSLPAVWGCAVDTSVLVHCT